MIFSIFDNKLLWEEYKDVRCRPNILFPQCTSLDPSLLIHLMSDLGLSKPGRLLKKDLIAYCYIFTPPRKLILGFRNTEIRSKWGGGMSR